MPQAYVAPAPLRAMSAATPDRCGARELGWLVGKPRTEIPVPVNLANRRVICIACERGPAVDERLSIYIDPDTDVVQQVGCG